MHTEMSPDLLRITLWVLGLKELAQENPVTLATANAVSDKVLYLCPRSAVSFAKIH